MHPGMSVSTQNEQPRQDDGNYSRSIDAIENQAEHIEQNRGFKLVGNVVGDLDHILWPYPVVYCRLLTIDLTGFYRRSFPHPKHNEHDQSQKYLSKERPENVAGVH